MTHWADSISKLRYLSGVVVLCMDFFLEGLLASASIPGFEPSDLEIRQLGILET